MTLFNPDNPRVAAAQAQVLDTLMAIPDEYGAVFVIDEYQTELTEAVRAHTRRQAVERLAKRLNELQAQRKRREQRQARVIVLSDWTEVGR